MADAAPGRFFCGLGASSQVIVANWNGMAFENQYRRIRDTLRFLRMAFSGEKVTEDFETFKVKGFRLARIPEQLPPVYLAALRPGMLHLAGKEADGAILNWLSAEDVATSVAEVEKAAGGAPREIVARIFVIVTEDANVARTVGRRMITAYLNVEAYAEFHRWLGRGPALQPMWDAWAAGDRKGALAAIPDEVVDDLVVHGSVAECRAHIAALRRPRDHHPGPRGHPDRDRPGRGRRRSLAVGRIGQRSAGRIGSRRGRDPGRGRGRAGVEAGVTDGGRAEPPRDVNETKRRIWGRHGRDRLPHHVAGRAHPLGPGQGGQRTGAHPGRPGSDPEARPDLQRLRRRGWGAGARRGRRGRRPHRRRRRPRAAGRDPARGQGPPERHRLPHHLRLGTARRRPARHRRRPLRGPDAGGRLCRRRQDQHARVRLDGQHDQRHLRPLAEPVRHSQRTGWIVRRGGGGAGGRDGAPRDRVRRRWIHPDPLAPAAASRA